MHVWTRLGFVYEADIHCASCAVAQFGPTLLNEDCGGVRDSEGNLVSPYTVGDASEYAAYQQAIGAYPHVHCGDCRTMLYEADFGPEEEHDGDALGNPRVRVRDCDSL